MTNIKRVGEISIFFVFVSLVSLYLVLISYNEYILPCYKKFPGRRTIKTFRVDLHGTYHFNEISICFEMHINIYCYKCCHWIGSLFLLFWKTHMYQKCMFCCYTRFEHMMCVYYILNTQTYMHKNKIHDTSMYI